MANSVLIHGPYTGGWIWRDITRQLREAGHEVYAPTLTGSGERVHLASPDITLDTWVQDIVNVLQFEDLDQVFLVGWSTGGIVSTGVADRVPERLERIIYVNGLAPEDGESECDLFQQFIPELYDEIIESDREKAETEGNGWRLPVFPEDSLRSMIPNVGRRAWYHSRLTPHLHRMSTEPLRLTKLDVNDVPRSYLYCSAEHAQQTDRFFARYTAHIRDSPGWDFHELDLSHYAPVTSPDDAVRAVLDVVVDHQERAGTL